MSAIVTHDGNALVLDPSTGTVGTASSSRRCRKAGRGKLLPASPRALFPLARSSQRMVARMIAPVVICGGLKAGAASLRRTRIGRPSTRLGTKAHFNRPVRGACGHRETVRYESALVAGRRIGHDRETVMFLPNNPARFNLSRHFGCPGTPFGNASLQACKQSSCCIADPFHLSRSFAPAFHEQKNTGATHELGWIVQGRGIFSQGGGDARP